MKLITLFAAILPFAALAGLRIATVDLVLLARNHPEAERNDKLVESTDKDYQRKVDAIKSEGEAMQAEGKKLMEQFDNPMLSEKAKADLKKQLGEMQQKLMGIEQRYRSEAMRCHQDLQDLRQRLMKTMSEDLHKRVKKYAEAQGFDLIVDSNAAVYAKDSFDVTDAILVDMGVDPRKAKGRNEGK